MVQMAMSPNETQMHGQLNLVYAVPSLNNHVTAINCTCGPVADDLVLEVQYELVLPLVNSSKATCRKELSKEQVVLYNLRFHKAQTDASCVPLLVACDMMLASLM